MTGESYYKNSNKEKKCTNSEFNVNNKFESDDEVLANFIANKKKNKSIVSLPPTPPTSSSRPATPMVNDFSMDSSDRSRDVYDFCVNREVECTTKINQKRKRGRPTLNRLQRAKKKHNLNDLYDSYDDNSRTLDDIIPPLKDFNGFNNPFLGEIMKRQIDSLNVSKTHNGTTVPTITNVKSSTQLLSHYKNSANGEIRVVRTVKRRLSARDIVIGPNMEVKRRKLKKFSGNVEVFNFYKPFPDFFLQ